MLGDQTDRLGKQCVACKDRGVLTERAVARRPAATQVVIVHRRQVVVEQGVRVDELQRRCGRQEILGIVAQALACRQAQHRADALAACKQ